MYWSIDKTFEFCYGHRVHSQVLDKPEYSVNTMCKCRHLHGHQGTVKLGLEGTKLDNGMVTDFHNLNWLKQWIDDVFDHKFIIDRNDPLFESFFFKDFSREVFDEMDDEMAQDGFLQIDADGSENPAITELFESFVVVDFVPTSENLAKFIFDMASEKMAKIENLRATAQNIQSETQRNVPEVDHLKSETILNLAMARAKAQGI